MQQTRLTPGCIPWSPKCPNRFVSSRDGASWSSDRVLRRTYYAKLKLARF